MQKHNHPFQLPALLAIFSLPAGLAAAWMQRYNFDEGVYYFLAQEIMAGHTPGVDFFYHQPPLYLYLLGFMQALGGTNVFVQRALHFGVYAAAVGVITVALRPHYAPRFRQWFAAIALAAPLAFPFSLVLPQAYMMVFAAGGIYFALQIDRRHHLWWIPCLLAAGMVKPIILPWVIGMYIALLWHYRHIDYWFQTGLATLVSLLAGAAALHIMTGGTFWELLAMQTGRLKDASGFDLMQSYPAIAELHAFLGIHSSGDLVRQQFVELVQQGWGYGSNIAFIAASALGLLVSLRTWRRLPVRIFVTMLACTLLSFFWIFDTVWEHYFALLVLPAAFLCTLLLQSLERRPSLAWMPWILWAVLLGTRAQALHVHSMRALYNEWQSHGLAGREVFTMTPFVNAATGTRPACGLYDFFNVYGDAALITLGDQTLAERFLIDEDSLIKCLHVTPNLIYYPGPEYHWFYSPKLDQHVHMLHRTRPGSPPMRDWRQPQRE